MNLLSIFKRERKVQPASKITAIRDKGHGWVIDVLSDDSLHRRFLMPKVHPYNSVVFPEPFIGALVRGGYMLTPAAIQMWYVQIEDKWWSIPTLPGRE